MKLTEWLEQTLPLLTRGITNKVEGEVEGYNKVMAYKVGDIIRIDLQQTTPSFSSSARFTNPGQYQSD